jgi:hypothetical protein
MSGKIAGLGCLMVVLLAVAFVAIDGYMDASGYSSHAPIKRFVVIDQLPQADPKCVTIRERRETLAHTAARLGWPVPGGVQGSGYDEVVTPAPWPCELRQQWVRNPIPEGVALEVQGEDALSATVTSDTGEARHVMLNYHNNSRDLDPSRRNDELALLGYHFISIPWNPIANAPACLQRSSLVIDWPPDGGVFIYLLFATILGLKVLDCIGKGNFTWLWSLLLYAALFALILHTVQAYADSRELCEPRAAAFAQSFVHDRTIHPFAASNLEGGPWIGDSSIVLASQASFFLAVILAIRLLWPAYIGIHYLVVPHPAEQLLKERARNSHGLESVSAEEIAAAMGRNVDINNPPPEYKSRNWQRRIDELRRRLEAETELLRSVIKNRRVRAEREDK